MEIPYIPKVDMYGAYNVYGNKDVFDKKSPEVKIAKDIPEKILSKKQSHGGNPRVTVSINTDLNLFVTRVVDASTNKVLRQIPPEDIIRMMKLLKPYRPSAPDGGQLLNDIVQ